MADTTEPLQSMEDSNSLSPALIDDDAAMDSDNISSWSSQASTLVSAEGFDLDDPFYVPPNPRIAICMDPGVMVTASTLAFGEPLDANSHSLVRYALVNGVERVLKCYDDEANFYAELKAVQELMKIPELSGRIPDFIGAVDDLPSLLRTVGLSHRGVFACGLVFGLVEGEPLEKVWDGFDKETMKAVYESAKEVMDIMHAHGFAHGDPFGRNFIVEFPQPQNQSQGVGWGGESSRAAISTADDDVDQEEGGVSLTGNVDELKIKPVVTLVDFSNVRFKHLASEIVWEEEIGREWKKLEHLRRRTTAIEVSNLAGRDFGVPWGHAILPMPARDIIYRPFP